MGNITHIPPHEPWYQTPDGWASQAGGTAGGGEKPELEYYVTTIEELRQAIDESGDRKKRIWVGGLIDASAGVPYVNRQDQSRRGRIFLGSNTTLIGIDNHAKFIESALLVQDASNVIIHNIFIENPVDVDPQFEEGDGWNAEWDGLSIIRSHHVWVSHVTFTDGRFTMDMYKEVDGWKYVQHDGSLDIKRASDYITVSNCLFNLHDKTILIGHNDSNDAEDTGKLRVTFYDNHFSRIVQRTPRVRFGNIHLYNNVFDNNTADPIYKYQYSFGVGKNSQTLSEYNIFDVKGLTDHCKLYKGFGGEFLTDSGSVFNQKAGDLNGCGFTPGVIKPPYAYSPHKELTGQFADAIRQAAGNVLNYRIRV